MEELANIKFGSKYSFDIFTFFNDLNAKIAIGNSVQPNIIFSQLFLIKYFIAGLIDFLLILYSPFSHV